MLICRPHAARVAQTGGVALTTHAQNWNVMLEKLGVHTCVTRTVRAASTQHPPSAPSSSLGPSLSGPPSPPLHYTPHTLPDTHAHLSHACATMRRVRCASQGKAVKAVEQQMAKQADRAMIGQVRLMLNKFGAKIKQSIHSAGAAGGVGIVAHTEAPLT